MLVRVSQFAVAVRYRGAFVLLEAVQRFSAEVVRHMITTDPRTTGLSTCGVRAGTTANAREHYRQGRCVREGRAVECRVVGGALFYCSDIQAKFGARGCPREANWVLGLPSTISTPVGRSGAVPR